MYLLITGKPGASKTSHALDMVINDTRLAPSDGSKRPVFYRGIRQLDPSLGWIELSDQEAFSWSDHVADNAVVIIDEAQQIFPTRGPSRPVPEGVQALETHRHRGLDVIFITQDPGLLDNNARKLANEHYHFERPYSAAYCIEYHSGTGFFNPNNKGELSQLPKRRRPLPKSVWGLYKSAEAHTHKFRIPKILIVLPLLVVAIIFMVWLAVRGITGMDENIMELSPNQPAATQQQPAGVYLGTQPNKEKTWSELLTPEIPSVPYTAPIYRGKATEVKSVPRLAACIESRRTGCRCYTQQGTPIAGVTPSMCANHVKNGSFDHLIAPTEPEPLYVDTPQGPMSPAMWRTVRAIRISQATTKQAVSR